jgi:Alkylmercury lyase
VLSMSDLSLRELRKFVFDTFLHRATAPLLEEVMQRFRVDRDEAARRLLALQAAHHLLLLPGTQRILMANPFSNLPTPFRVATESLTYYANCAWDSIALHLVLEREVRISSYCHHCAVPIDLQLRHGQRVDGAGAEVRVFLGTPVSKWYDNLVETCSNTMVFFASPQHLADWQGTHPGAVGASLSVDQTIEVVATISRRRATLEYEMPSRDLLMAHWRSLGLRGAFWTF